MQSPATNLPSLLRQQGARTSRWARVLGGATLVAGAWAVSVVAAPAQARDVHFSVGISAPGVSVGVSSAPPVVYYPPAVVHYPPPVVHYPAPVVVHPVPVYQPRPVVVYSQPAVPIGRPVVVVPQPVYHERPRHPGHRHGHHKGDRHHKHHGPHHRY